MPTSDATPHDSDQDGRARSSFAFRCVIVAALCHVVAAWFTAGYMHPDEHFQLLEYANYQLGRSPASDLPWEFAEQMRPALQPAIVYMAHRAAAAVGLDDPFVVAFALRLVSAALGLTASVVLWCQARRWFASERRQRWLLLAALFFWAVPLLHARFSSESWSGALLTLGLVALLKGADAATTRRGLWFGAAAGLTLGLAFGFRFQTGFSLVGIALWVLVVRRPRAAFTATCFVAALAALGVGVLADRWFYGAWVLSPLRYFHANVVEGRAAAFGVSSWWYYPQNVLLGLIPPFSAALLAAMVLACVRHWRNVLVWAVVPFVAAHLAVGHKETRFLTPMLSLVAPLVFLGVEGLAPPLTARLRRLAATRWARVAVGVFLVLNGLLFVAMTLRPASKTDVIWRWMHAQGAAGAHVVWAYQTDPYEREGLRVNYYRSPNVTVRMLPDATALDAAAVTAGGHISVFFEGTRPPPGLLAAHGNWEAECQSVPVWVQRIVAVVDTRDWLAGQHVWSVFRFTRAM